MIKVGYKDLWCLEVYANVSGVQQSARGLTWKIRPRSHVNFVRYETVVCRPNNNSNTYKVQKFEMQVGNIPHVIKHG